MASSAEAFSAKLGHVMDQLNLSRVGLASELAVDKSVVGRWLTGVNQPTGHNLTRLTEVVRKRAPGFTLAHWRGSLAAIGEVLGVPPEAPAAGASASPRQATLADSAPHAPNGPSLAVLPFANMSGEPQQDYFADGLTEEIITALSRIRWLFVTARNSTAGYKGRSVDVKQVGRDLGVRYVLEGSVRTSGGRIRITGQLIDATTGAHLWADRFDGPVEDVFALQDSVASALAGVIEPALQAAETARAMARPTSDLNAHDLHLRARALVLSTTGQTTEALGLLDQAIALEPNHGPALAWAAFCCYRLVYDGRSDDREADRLKGIDFARRALQAAGDDPDTLATGAFALAYFGEDIGAMIALVDRALALNPNFARGWYISGVLRGWAGQVDTTVAHLETSLRLSPRARIGAAMSVMGQALFLARRFDDAASKLLLAVQEDPSYPQPYRLLAACYAHMGRLDDARESIARLRSIAPVMIDVGYLRSPEHRELFLSGLRLAAGETGAARAGLPQRTPPTLSPTPAPASALDLNGKRQGPLALSDKPSIAVLPFTNMVGSTDQEYLSDGIAEDVITALSRYPSLFVIARNSSFTYKGRAVDLKQVGRELSVRYVLEGSLRRAASRVRVTAQLIETETGTHIWADRYDRDITDVFAVQDEITYAVTTAIAPAIADAERHRALRRPPDSHDAWSAYQRGLWHLSKATPEENRQAQRCFEEAITLDPNYSGNCSGLVLALMQESGLFGTLSVTDAKGRIMDLALRAVALDDRDAEAHACLSWAMNFNGDYEGALVEARRALAISPNLASAHRAMGTTLIFAGDPVGGLAALAICLRLDPRDPLIAWHLNRVAIGHYFCRNYDAAIDAARQVIRTYPDFPLIYRWYAAALGQTGRTAEAKVALDKAIAIAPASFDMYARKRVPWHRAEDHEHMVDGLRKAGWAG